MTCAHPIFMDGAMGWFSLFVLIVFAVVAYACMPVRFPPNDGDDDT